MHSSSFYWLLAVRISLTKLYVNGQISGACNEKVICETSGLCHSVAEVFSLVGY
jgi:hypothetical protein